MWKSLLALAGLASLFMVGCVSVRSGGGDYSTTSAVCDNASIERQRSTLYDRSREIRGAIAVGLPAGGGALGVEREKTDVYRQVDSVQRRLNFYDAEIDALFQNMTSNCKSYALCMDNNGYKEGRCRSSMMSWQDSQRELAQLSRELREIEAEVAKIEIVAENDCCKPAYPPKRKKHRKRSDCDCGDSVGGVFANCCYEDDKRRRGRY